MQFNQDSKRIICNLNNLGLNSSKLLSASHKHPRKIKKKKNDIKVWRTYNVFSLHITMMEYIGMAIETNADDAEVILYSAMPKKQM